MSSGTVGRVHVRECRSAKNIKLQKKMDTREYQDKFSAERSFGVPNGGIGLHAAWATRGRTYLHVPASGNPCLVLGIVLGSQSRYDIMRVPFKHAPATLVSMGLGYAGWVLTKEQVSAAVLHKESSPIVVLLPNVSIYRER